MKKLRSGCLAHRGCALAPTFPSAVKARMLQIQPARCCTLSQAWMSTLSVSKASPRSSVCATFRLCGHDPLGHRNLPGNVRSETKSGFFSCTDRFRTGRGLQPPYFNSFCTLPPNLLVSCAQMCEDSCQNQVPRTDLPLDLAVKCRFLHLSTAGVWDRTILCCRGLSCVL